MIKHVLILAVAISSLARPAHAQANLTSEVRPYKGACSICGSEDNFAGSHLKDPRDPSLQRDLPGFRINPRFWSDDPKAQMLGMLEDVNKPGLVVKKVASWTSIYSSAPIPSRGAVAQYRPCGTVSGL